jgi:predicted DsbA family dithiol-disulfide isomerase
VGYERSTWLERRFGAEVEWFPFDLHPEYPPEGIPRAQLIARYGEETIDRVRRGVEECGYSYNPHPDVVPNSHQALEVTELARERGLHEPVHTRLMHAYWSEAANIGDVDTLLGLVAEVGLDRSEAADALAAGTYRDAIRSSTREANAIGINAIPAFVLDRRLLLVGAYPHESFELAFARLAELDGAG